MTIHLVYPHDRTRRASAPWSIGYNLATGLRKRGHQVRCYDWDEELCIYPDSPEDILIGHPHPEPGKCFRTSVCGPWKKSYSIAPWNGSEEYRRDQEYVFDHTDWHFTICGQRWFDDFGAHQPFVTRLDMAIDADFYPQLKPTYNPPGQRRFLYIGCTVPIKGTAYLSKIRGHMSWLGHLGYGAVDGAENYGYIDLQSERGRATVAAYDYLIMPGIHDANPTTVLEAMSWGLIPVLSDGCGYVDGDYHGFRLARDISKDAVLISELQRAEETTLLDLAAQNRRLVRSRYTWQRFIESVALVLEA